MKIGPFDVNAGSAARWSVSASLGLVLSGAAFGQTPTVDGVFNPGEGYTTDQTYTFTLTGGSNPVGTAQFYTYQDPATHDVNFALVMPESIVDNTYGANSIGWGKQGHKFNDLVGSDEATFNITNGAGQSVSDFQFDYISQVGKGGKGAATTYASLGTTGGDGKVVSGAKTPLLAWDTSEAYNLSQYPSLTTDSPLTDANYTPNPTYPNWDYAVTYEGQIDGSIFGPSGYGAADVTFVHASPNKQGKDIPPVPGPPVPEPSTLALMALPMIGLVLRRRFASRA